MVANAVGEMDTSALSDAEGDDETLEFELGDSAALEVLLALPLTDAFEENDAGAEASMLVRALQDAEMLTPSLDVPTRE